MPYIGEPYDEQYFHAFSERDINGDLIRPEGYHDYPDGNLDGGLWSRIADDIEATTGLVSGKDVLDVGCGYGYLTDELTSRGASAVGIDLSAWAISQAQTLFPALTFTQGDFLTSPYANNQFNLSVICGTLECMSTDPEIASFLNELNRVTRNNGNMYFLIENNLGPSPIYQQKTAAEWCAELNAGIPGPFTFDCQDVGHLPLYYGTRTVVS